MAHPIYLSDLASGLAFGFNFAVASFEFAGGISFEHRLDHAAAGSLARDLKVPRIRRILGGP